MESFWDFWGINLTGLLNLMRNQVWVIVTFLVEVPKNRTGIVIELKYAEDGNMDDACEKALQQIEDRDYAAKLKDDGMRNIIKYGIACYKKNCKVMLG